MQPQLTQERRTLASGGGWRVTEIVVNAGSPRDILEDRHAFAAIGVVVAGSFRYRSSRGAAMLSPGALLLGNAGDDYACSYEHAPGDRCLAFTYAPSYLDEIVRSIDGVCRCDFPTHHIPPLAAALPPAAAVEIGAAAGDTARLEEVALHLAGSVFSLVADVPCRRLPSSRDERRIADALQVIERRFDEPLSIAELAGVARMSRYHFLRVFRDVVGVTPHQLVLRTRLRHAAIALATTRDPISAIAFDAGFGDLSTFVGTFRKVFGVPPRAYRLAAQVGGVPQPRLRGVAP